MRRLVRCVCLLLVLTLCASCVAYAEKQEEQAGTYSMYFTSYGVCLAKLTERKFEIAFDLICRDDMYELGVSSLAIQRTTDPNGSWTTVKTYTPDSYPELMDANDEVHSAAVYYSGVMGYYYRAYATFYASNSRGCGYVSAYSNVVHIY